MKALKALSAFVMLVLLLGAVPALLLAWGDPLSLAGVPWSTALMRPDDGTILLGLLSALGWLAWVVLAVTTIVELTSLLSRQRIRPHLPGISWLQPTVGALLAMALSPILTSNADEPATPPASHAPHQVSKHRVSEHQDHVSPNSPKSTPTSRDYVVNAGDELWGVAERELGTGPDWRAIVAVNPGMTASTVLTPGQVIQLPAAAHPSNTAQVPHPFVVVVERGDTLWDLAGEHLGDAHRWPEIFNANREVVTDPDEIDIGWQLTVAIDAPTHQPSLDNTSPVDTQPALPDHEDNDDPAAHRTDAPSDPAVPFEGPPATTSPSASEEISALPISTDQPRMVTPPPRTDSIPSVGTDDEYRHRGSSQSNFDAVGPVGGALAASLVAGIVARRRLQFLHRGVGNRVRPTEPALQRFFAGLVQRSEVPEANPKRSATSVVLGWNHDGDVEVDLELQRCTLLNGSDEHTKGIGAAILTSLLCADWSDAVEVIAVQPHEAWSSALDDPRLTSRSDLGEALTHLQKLCAQRRLQLGHDTLNDVRSDPDRASMWAPVVFIFCRALQPSDLDRIRDFLSLGAVGVSVVAAHRSPDDTQPHESVVHIESETEGKLNDGPAFQPQLLSAPARHAVLSLFISALDERTTPAPWWRDGDETVATVSPNTAAGPPEDGAMSTWPTQPENPTLFLLGTVELLGCSGEPPNRATGQCIEYCAWLLLHPGSSPTAMVRELLVAETTRRSNMSRLRTWLGNDKDNNPYLPDAYSGRISLATSVTSDWERFQSLLTGGVNTSSTPLLREALSLVRGKPLDGVSFQWPWTSLWLSDMTSMISDAATALADRYLTERDCAGALWAIAQGQLATGQDETLAVRRIQALAMQGAIEDVEAAVTELTRAARATNQDLSADSIRRIQHALHLTMQRVPTP